MLLLTPTGGDIEEPAYGHTVSLPPPRAKAAMMLYFRWPAISFSTISLIDIEDMLFV